MRYQWEFVNTNRNYAILHLDRRFPAYGRCEYGRAWYHDKTMPEDVKAVLERLGAIPGVETVSVGGLGRYQATLTKGAVFAWDEIVPSFQEIVLAYFGEVDAGEIQTVIND